MSLDALNWAGRQTVGRPTTKAVLVALAHYANGKALAWPSLAELASFTEIHRRQLMREMVRLQRVLLIEDSGDRRGRTKQIKVWKLAVAQDSLALPSGKGDSRRALSGPRKGDNIAHPFNGQKPGQGPAKGDTGGTVPLRARKGDTGVTRNLHRNNTDSNESDGEAVDPIKELFDLGVAILGESGVRERDARELVGKWRKGKGDAEVVAALWECHRLAIANPAAWITAKLKTPKFVSESGFEYRGSLEQIRKKADERRDLPTYYAVERAIAEEREARQVKGG